MGIVAGVVVGIVAGVVVGVGRRCGHRDDIGFCVEGVKKDLGRVWW